MRSPLNFFFFFLPLVLQSIDEGGGGEGGGGDEHFTVHCYNILIFATFVFHLLFH